MRGRSGCSHKFFGSRTIETYPADKIYEEAAFLGYYMHWSREEVLHMNHLERLRWCKEVSQINSKLNDEDKPENIFERI
ncbi:MAG: DUF6760 family protein [Oscillospiraceae bacterium]